MSRSNEIGPTLVLLDPAGSSRIYELTGDAVWIGRDPGLEIVIDDKVVSWHHARIERDPDGSYRVLDLGSRNRTQLDGVDLEPNRPMPLGDKALIRVARKFELSFSRRGFELNDEDSDSTIRKTVVPSLDPLQQRLGPAEPLRAMLEISRALGGGELNDVLGRALTGLMVVFPSAEHGCIVTVEPDGTYQVRAVHARKGSPMPPALSRTVVRQVIEKGEAVWIGDARTDNRFNDAESIHLAGIRTAIAAPLAGHDGRPLGMIQIDRRSENEGFNEPDLHLLAALATPVGVAIENDRLHRERTAWAAAREVQQALLPRGRPQVAGYEFWEYYRPAQEVGGDLYDYIPVDPAGSEEASTTGRWAVTVGDVSGKGMPAALLMAGMGPAVRYLAASDLSPELVLNRVNRRLYHQNFDGRFVTMVLAVLDTTTHRVTLANAGHVDPIIRRADGTIEEVGVDTAGVPLGILRDSAFAAATLTLGRGDVLVLVSDGVIEAHDRNNSLFGMDKLRSVLTHAPRGAVRLGEAIAESVRAHASGRTQFDDITIVCFGRS